MKVILVALPVLSLAFALVGGRMGELSGAVIEKSGEAVTLAVSLCGVMCFWCGLMKVAERSGILELLTRALSPVVALLFKGIDRGGRAARLICANIAANLLGLGNASTPMGISAMSALAEEERAGDVATDNMIMLAVVNTASLQLIPTTAAALRAANGAARPMEILPCVWVVSIYAAFAAIASAKLMAVLSRRRKPPS